MKLAIGHEEITKASRLRLISTATTGSDHIATDACAGRGITVRTLREDNDFLQEITPAAEHTWALLLGLIRNLPGAVAHVREGAWDRERFPSFLLDGKTIGIVGFGRLGAKVAHFARAFNMEIIAYDPLVTNWPTFVSSTSLEKLFSQADVISLHVHLTEETKGFINAPLLAQ
ncbi:MAG: NAD(P)-dependent oxidoreductase, partial [Gammaproteobacteria bacterium]